MREVLGLVAYLTLPAIGFSVVRLREVRRMSLDGRLAAAAAAGALTVALVMSIMSLAGLTWSLAHILPIFGAICLCSVVWVRAASTSGTVHPETGLSALLTCGLLLLASYGALSARMTSGDMNFFWVPKAVAFVRARSIDVAFLRNPDYYLMHSDYPPLMPLIYAWTNIISIHFAWFAAVFASILCLAAIVAIIRASSRDATGTLLAAAVLTYAFGLNFVAGGADPLLLLFETLTLAALTFLQDGRSQIILVSVGLAGGVLTKVEGASFLVAVIVTLIFLRRGARSIAGMVLPSVVVLGAWIVFVWKHDLLDAYRIGGKGLYLSALPETIILLVGHARFDALWLPWLAPLAMIAIGPNRRRAMVPLLVGALNAAAIVYFYLHDPHPAFWIASSANRTLLPPLLALCVAGAASGPMHVEVEAKSQKVTLSGETGEAPSN
ncbi:MAG TPA: hypothetical protein VF850_15165 [Gemmatimonadaceae bacterium]